MPTPNANHSRILVVDDEPELLTLYKLVLESEGYRVETASDGKSASELLKKGGFDLALLDIMLPELTGLEILEELKKLGPPSQPVNKILLLTNMVQDSAVSQGLGLGAAGYLIKSDYNPEEFLAQVKRFLSGQAVENKTHLLSYN